MNNVGNEEPQTMNNIDYLSYGYNLLKGNPLENVDPGFSDQKIFKLSYEKKELSKDQRFLVPDHVNLRI